MEVAPPEAISGLDHTTISHLRLHLLQEHSWSGAYNGNDANLLALTDRSSYSDDAIGLSDPLFEI